MAARCAIRGAVDHLNNAIENGLLRTTTVISNFRSSHDLIVFRKFFTVFFKLSMLPMVLFSRKAGLSQLFVALSCCQLRIQQASFSAPVMLETLCVLSTAKLMEQEKLPRHLMKLNNTEI